ncbi:MAG: TlpA disulfide reductase family protein [Acidobacteriota bacterium]
MQRVPLTCILLMAVFLGGQAAGGAETRPRPVFPDVQLLDLGGQPVQLSSVLGKITILNFWATWCGPCRAELPELQRMYNDLGGDGLAVLAINVDDPQLGRTDVPQQVQAIRPVIESFGRRVGLALPVFLVDGRTQYELGLDRLPLTVVLDGGGRVIIVYPGYSEQGMRDLRERVAKELAETGGKEGA